MDIIPDRTVPIVGWRVWIVLSDRRLRSPMFGIPWVPRRAVSASCLARSPILHAPEKALIRPHSVPSAECTCGIYASRNLSDLVSNQLPTSLRVSLRNQQNPPWLIAGKVELWGRVLCGERGYRAEYAKPAAFLIPETKLDLAVLLEDTYECAAKVIPPTFFDDREALLREDALPMTN